MELFSPNRLFVVVAMVACMNVVIDMTVMHWWYGWNFQNLARGSPLQVGQVFCLDFFFGDGVVFTFCPIGEVFMEDFCGFLVVSCFESNLPGLLKFLGGVDLSL